MDSRFGKDCTNLEVEYLIEPGTDRIFSQSDWSFIDMTGCHIAPGELTVIMEIPEHDLYGTEVINLLRERDDYCIDSTLSIDAEFSGDETLTVSPEISSIVSSDLTWFNSCGVFSTLYKNGQENETVDLVIGAVRVSNASVNSPSPCCDMSTSNDSNSIVVN